jgi:hypothetical protein
MQQPRLLLATVLLLITLLMLPPFLMATQQQLLPTMLLLLMAVPLMLPRAMTILMKLVNMHNFLLLYGPESLRYALM